MSNRTYRARDKAIESGLTVVLVLVLVCGTHSNTVMWNMDICRLETELNTYV